MSKRKIEDNEDEAIVSDFVEVQVNHYSDYGDSDSEPSKKTKIKEEEDDDYKPYDTDQAKGGGKMTRRSQRNKKGDNYVSIDYSDSDVEDEAIKKRRRRKMEEGNVSTLCDVCGKTFANRDNLKFHKRIHTGYKPFSCSKCSKCFSRKDQLKEHMRIHTGEKPYICDVCGRGFSQRSPLKIHQRTHTGEKPFICRFCNKGFTAKGSMNVHAKKCQGPLIWHDDNDGDNNSDL